MTIEQLKDKLHDKIEIHVCEVEENTLIAQGMLKALGMMDEVLEKAEQEPTVVKTKDVYVSTSMTATVVTTKESEDLDGEEVEDAYQVRLSVKDVIDNLKRIVDQGRVNSLDALYLFGACQFLEQIKE